MNKPKSGNHQSDRVRLAGGFCLALVLFSASCGPKPGGFGEYEQVREFSLIERSGREFRSDELEGKIWVAHFFFAGCSTECRAITHHLAELQRRVEGMDEVRLVSFTTDPRSDTPEVLRRYAEACGADAERWVFLTGDRKELYGVITRSFLMPVAASAREKAELMGGFIHTEKLAVVDRRGRVRAYFDGLDEGVTEKVLGAVERLRAEPSPAVRPPKETNEPG